MDTNAHIASLKEAGTRLSVDTAELCGMVLLRELERESLDLDEDDVVDHLARAHEQFDASEQHRTRASNTLERLRDQRLITRVDAAGLTRKGRYALSPLGRAIVDFFVEDDRLTQESLTVLTATLRAHLGAVRDNARAARSDEDWRTGVTAKLTVAAVDLLDGIERRARGLDAQQDRVRQQIAQMLTDDWAAAIEHAEAVLLASTKTLDELSRVLLDEQTALDVLLDEIEALATHAAQDAPAIAARSAAARLAQLADWGRKRHQTWSQYMQLMLTTLRSIIRLDPDRAISQRLRDAIRQGGSPGFLTLPSLSRAAVLREMDAAVDRANVERPCTPDAEAKSISKPVEITIEQRVALALDAGAASLVAVLHAVLPALPEAERYESVGRIAHFVAQKRKVSAGLEPAWTLLVDGIFVTDWSLEARR